MAVEFKETSEGISLLVNGDELTLYLKDSEHGYTLRNDFKLEVDEIDELLRLKFTDLPDVFEYYHDEYTEVNGASISFHINEYDISFRIEHILHDWANYYPFKKFNRVFKDQLSKGSYEVNTSEFFEVILSVGVSKSEYEAMLVGVQKALAFIKKCSHDAHKILEEETRGDVFVKVFEFPFEYKNICSQYLIWFGEFLKNLGIDANVSTNQRKNQTHLIVSPNECPELLAEIEKLFYQYLSLPYAELLPPDSNLTPQELHAYQTVKMQVQHLQTQVQMKDSVIASYQATNASLMNKISEKDSELMLINSLKEENKFEVFDGILKINKVQKIGKNDNASIDLFKIYNKLIKK